MTLLLHLFGEGENLNSLQMGCRVIVIFIVSILLIHVAGKRSFGLHSTYDIIVGYLLGAVLSRAVVGASPFFPTVFTCFILALCHRFFAYCGVKSRLFGKYTKGTKILLYNKGDFLEKNLALSLVSKEDILEELRQEFHKMSLENIEEIYMERSGRVSFITKERIEKF